MTTSPSQPSKSVPSLPSTHESDSVDTPPPPPPPPPQMIDTDASAAEGEVLANTYVIGKKLGNGSFGEIRLGKNITTGKEVAIKLERQTAHVPQLPREHHLYKSIGQHEGIANFYHYGPLAKVRFNALVIELLGPSLEQIFNKCNRKFSIKTVLQIGLQLLERFEFLHSKEILFRDTKPENFLIGLPEAQKRNVIHVVDFGLAKKYIENGKHIVQRQKRGITGTARYCSIATHDGLEQSRRDDIEALSYLMMYFFCGGKLPWQGLTALDKVQRYRKIGDLKKTFSLDVLCSGVPSMKQFITLARSLDFEEKPDYATLRRILEQMFTEHDITKDQAMDWDNTPVELTPLEVHETPGRLGSNISNQKLRSPVSAVAKSLPQRKGRSVPKQAVDEEVPKKK